MEVLDDDKKEKKTQTPLCCNMIYLRRHELVVVWKIWLHEFLKIFAYVIFMVFRGYSWVKTIPHCETSPWNGGDLKICVQYSLFCMKYKGKNVTFRTEFRFYKNELMKFWKNDICIGIVFIIVRKKWGVTDEILKRGCLKLWKYVKWEEVW